jgi:hypothetical protein
MAAVLIGALAFGLFAAWVKGQATDGLSTVSQLRSAVGNLSAPWLLVAFVAGTQFPRPLTASLFGLLATMLGLAGFYLLTTLVVDLGGHGYLDNLVRELSANRAYLEGGVLTGPVFGALGWWWRQTRSLRASVLAGALMMGEPLVLLVVGAVFSGGVSGGALPLVLRIVPGWGLSVDRPASSIAVYAVEFGLGLAVIVLATVSARRASERDAGRIGAG